MSLLPFFEIDHLLVGPRGLFAIEVSAGAGSPATPAGCTAIRDKCWPQRTLVRDDGREMSRYASSPSRATPSASSTKPRTAGRSSPARQATHSDVGGTPLPGTKTRPGRALYSSDDAGHKLMPRPATMCSRHSSMVRATAPMTGASPPGRGLTSHSSRQRRGREARLFGDRDEVPQLPQFYVHPGRNPNHRASTGTVDTITIREA
jgi:hypothetical protein